MVSKEKIMQEWREFMRRREDMVRMYTKQPRDDHDTPFSSPYPPGSPARAPASLPMVMSDL